MDEPAATERRYVALLALGVAPFFVNGWINSLIHEVPLLFWSLDLLCWVVLPVIVFTLAFRAGLRWDELGIITSIHGRRNFPRLVFTCVLFAPLAFVLVRLALLWARSLVPNSAFFSYRQVIPDVGLLRELILLYMALSAGIVEELYYRGLLYRICRFHASPRLLFLCVSPLLFSAVHWENGPVDMLAAWIVGVVFGLAFFWFRNLLPLIVAHAFTDYLIFS